MLELFQQWATGVLDKPIDSNIEEYSQINLTRKIAGYLDEIMHP
jgi:hypothetical protein